jgi:hypothetical protein
MRIHAQPCKGRADNHEVINSLKDMRMREVVTPNLPPASAESICTLFEGDYHFGLAAFINSLVRAGYSGTVWVGYRGTLPPWIHQLKPLDSQGREYMVADQVRLVFLLLETTIHFTSYKPQFMLDLLQDQARDCSYLWYFDPDIFLRCKWSFFSDWQRYGIALCEDIVMNAVRENSPLRHKWMEVAGGIGLGTPRALNHYFNGGMVGLSPAHASFLTLWNRFIQLGETAGGNIQQILSGSRALPFYILDQDALNMAAMYTEHPLSTMGPEAMGFETGGFTMYHTVGPKPWKGSLLRRALDGRPPTNAFRFFFTQVSSPIQAYSPWRLRSKQLACSIATFIGRFYSRG